MPSSNSSLPFRQELVKQYDVPAVVHTIPIERYYAMAKRVNDEALKAIARGDLVLSYKYLHHVVTLINDRITKHNDYSKHNPNRMWGVKTCKRCLEVLEEVVRRMDKSVDIQLERERIRKHDEDLIDLFDGDCSATTSTKSVVSIVVPADPYPPILSSFPSDPYPPIENSSTSPTLILRHTSIPRDSSLLASIPVSPDVSAPTEFQFKDEPELVPTEALYPRQNAYVLPPAMYNRFAGVTVPDVEILKRICSKQNFFIPNPYVANYELSIGKNLYIFQSLDFHVTFNNFLKELPPELQMAKSAVEVNRCFFLHLGVGTNIHPFKLQMAFRNVTANKLLKLAKDDIQTEILTCVMEYAGMVDGNVLNFLWPVEYNQYRICIISGDSAKPMLSYFCSDALDPRLPVKVVIIRCEQSHFTLLKLFCDMDQVDIAFLQLIRDAEKSGLVVQRFTPTSSFSVATTVDKIIGQA